MSYLLAETLGFNPVVLVPAHFVTPEIVQRRNPLKPTARRAGWVGSNILMSRISPEAKIDIVCEGEELPRAKVRERFKRFSFMRDHAPESRGWLADVITCIRLLGKEFTLSDLYAFEGKLAELHPVNRNVRPKIRQQLQILRDNGVLEFVGKGRYRRKS